MTDVNTELAASPWTSRRFHLALLIVTIVASCNLGNAAAQEEGYYGKHLGKLKQLHHGVSGDVYAVDARTLHIRDFTYDGEGPAAYFYVGNSKAPSGSGIRINDEKGSPNVLPRYRKQHITLTLPEGKTLNNIKWFSVWCDEFSVNFGDVRIPKGFTFPRPQKLESLKGIHGVSSENVVIVDAQTLLVPSFSYDGEAPDAKFWVGTGSKPSPQGIRIPDENGKKEHPLRRYDQKTIVLTLPGDMTVFDIGHFGVWCEAFAVDFGHVKIPKNSNVPPSLKMLGVSPQKRPRSLQLLPEQSRFQQLLQFPGNQEQLRSAEQRQLQPQQQQQYFVNQGGENNAAQYINTQFYEATTYKPTFQLRNLHQRADDDTFQIIPSVSVSPPAPFFGQATHNQYEIIQPYQTQQSHVYVNHNDNNQHYQAHHQQQQQQPQYHRVVQPVYQQRSYEIDDGGVKGQASGKSFSRVSFNGAGGPSNTYIQY